jgi:MotA/TolQ/ExbB proton channel family
MGYPIAPTLTRERADSADPAPGEAGGRAAEIMARLLWLGNGGAGRSRADAGAAAPVAAASGRGAPLAFLSRCVVLQAIGAAGLVGLWIAGIASRPFESDNGFLCWLIVAIAALGVLCVFLQRWSDVEWLATHVVRIGLLGTVIGLIIAFSAAKAGGSADPSAIKPMIAAVVDGMYVSLYATLLGIATNLWLKINLRLLGHADG